MLHKQLKTHLTEAEYAEYVAHWQVDILENAWQCFINTIL